MPSSPDRTPTPESQRSWLVRQAGKLLGPRLRSRVDAEDLAQDVLAQAAKDRDHLHFEGRGQLRGWLGRALRHRAVDLGRRAGGAAGGDSAIARHPGRDTTPLSAAMRNESDLAVQRHLRGLDEREKRVVLLRVVEDLPFREIAARLEISEENARMIFSRSTRRLQELGRRDE